MNEIELQLDINPDSLTYSLSRMNRDKLREFLMDLDSLVGEVEFTEELIRDLVKSLKYDADEVTKLPFIDWSMVK